MRSMARARHVSADKLRASDANPGCRALNGTFAVIAVLNAASFPWDTANGGEGRNRAVYVRFLGSEYALFLGNSINSFSLGEPELTPLLKISLKLLAEARPISTSMRLHGHSHLRLHMWTVLI